MPGWRCVTAVATGTWTAEGVDVGTLIDQLPSGLLGYATDYANGVTEDATPVEELLRLIAASAEVFGEVLAAALPHVAAHPPEPPGLVHRFEA